MMLRLLSLAVLLLLAGPAVVPADTVYFSRPGETGIHSVSGTVVKETGSLLEITTEDGRTVSIPRGNVFQIVRGTPAATGRPDDDRAATLSADAYHFGLKGGMNIANMSVDPQELEDENSLQSYAVGAWWGFPVSRRLTIQPEALYSVKGDSESSGGYTSSTHMGYIDVPVLVKVRFLRGSSARPSLYLGPSLALNLSGNAKLEGNGTNIDVDVKDQIRPFGFDLVVGGGLDFQVGARTYGVDLRYSVGLTDVTVESANGSGRNDVIAVMGSIGLQ